MAEQVQDTLGRTAPSPRWVTLRRACEILGVDESTLRRWADTGRLRSYRTPGGHRRFSLVNLAAMVAGETRTRRPPPGERWKGYRPWIRSPARRAQLGASHPSACVFTGSVPVGVARHGMA